MNRSVRRRDLEASRRAVLDAAEELFAAQGFHATSLQEICDRTGLSRGMPSYLFGSKEGVYRAVLDRFHDAPAEPIRRALREAADDADDPPTALRKAIEANFDFLVQNPNFVRLMQWEALYGGHGPGAREGRTNTLREAMDALSQRFGLGALDEAEAGQFLTSIVALAWFPLAHARTFLEPLGLDASDPAFLAQRRRHVVRVIVDALSAHVRRHDRA